MSRHGRVGAFHHEDKPHPLLDHVSTQKNCDHIITEEERNVFHEDFSHIDMDGDSVIDAHEISHLLEVYAF